MRVVAVRVANASRRAASVRSLSTVVGYCGERRDRRNAPGFHPRSVECLLSEPLSRTNVSHSPFSLGSSVVSEKCGPVRRFSTLGDGSDVGFQTGHNELNESPRRSRAQNKANKKVFKEYDDFKVNLQLNRTIKQINTLEDLDNLLLDKLAKFDSGNVSIAIKRAFDIRKRTNENVFPLYAAMEKHLLKNYLGIMSPLETCNVMNYFSLVGFVPHPKLTQDAEKIYLQPRFKGIDVAQITSAFARLRMRPSPEFAEQIFRFLDGQDKLKMNARDLTQTMWGLASLGFKPTSEERRTAIDARLQKELGRMSLRDVADTFWSMVKFQMVPSEELYDRIEQKCLYEIQKGNGNLRDMSKLALCLSSLDYSLGKCGPVLFAVVKVFSEILEELDGSHHFDIGYDVWSMLTSLQVMGVSQDEPAVADMIKQIEFIMENHPQQISEAKIPQIVQLLSSF